MISFITYLKLGFYSAAISTSAGFKQREASVYGTSFAVALAIWRSLARALWPFPAESTSKRDPEAKKHFHARNCVARYLSVAISVLYIVVFCVKAHAQPIDEPFGLTSASTEEGEITETWKELLVEINNDLSVVATCREKPDSCSSPAAIKFLRVAKEAEQYDGLARIGHLNRAANLAIRAFDTTHADDKWLSPLAILARSSGDCKHYAVLKYAMLREIGIPPDALRIVVVEVRSLQRQHAILAVRVEKGRWLLLDNRTLILAESSSALNYYDPLYELDHNGARQLGSPTLPSPQVAGAPRYAQMGQGK